MCCSWAANWLSTLEPDLNREPLPGEWRWLSQSFKMQDNTCVHAGESNKRETLAGTLMWSVNAIRNVPCSIHPVRIENLMTRRSCLHDTVCCCLVITAAFYMWWHWEEGGHYSKLMDRKWLKHLQYLSKTQPETTCRQYMDIAPAFHYSSNVCVCRIWHGENTHNRWREASFTLCPPLPLVPPPAWLF